MTSLQDRVQSFVSGQQIVEAILHYAQDQQSSDIHIEPLDGCMRVRFRCDGVLVPVCEIPIERLQTITARIKILAHLDIANKIVPQDGRFSWQGLDIRVSTMPTIRGEKIVLRMLDSLRLERRLQTLGMAHRAYTLLMGLLAKRQGLFLISGPTGSGKSTTLYAMLQELDDPSRSIATLEDPVEYGLSGISQSQIHPKQGLYFQNGLRALLRQDPDILVIGEIRDAETAQIAVRAALTGHMVLSTIHTAAAVDVPLRLIDMGVPPYLVADSLLGIMSQRLPRRLCHCKTRDDAQHYQAKGCPVCYQRGYVGRFCLAEVVPVGTALRESIRQQANSSAMAAAAAHDGAMLFAAAMDEALQRGVTDRAELVRVYGL